MSIENWRLRQLDKGTKKGKIAARLGRTIIGLFGDTPLPSAEGLVVSATTDKPESAKAVEKPIVTDFEPSLHRRVRPEIPIVVQRQREREWEIPTSIQRRK